MKRLIAAVFGIAAVTAITAWMMATSVALVVALASLPLMGFTFRGVRRNGRRRPILPVGASWAEFHRELDRTRRFERQLSLIRLSLPTIRTSEELFALHATVSATLRTIDAAWVDDGSVYVMLPETPASGAHVFLQRFLLSSQRTDVQHSIAIFPDDGVTAAALLAALDATPREVVAAPGGPIPMIPLAPRSVPVLTDEKRHDLGR